MTQNGIIQTIQPDPLTVIIEAAEETETAEDRLLEAEETEAEPENLPQWKLPTM